MKKIININLAGRLIPIEDSAYEMLSQYLNSLKKYFSKEEGGDEIVADIESRIAELFHDKLKKGAHCITDEDINAVKASMGTPEQFDESSTSSNTQQEASSQAEETYNPRPRKRLYRDPDSKVLGGVCGGLGAYFNIDPVIFRIIFALLAIGGFGTGILAYFVLWVATPSADTAAEKLEMRGERVDLNSIKNTIQDEINQMKGQAKNVGNDIRNFSQGRGKQIGNDIERMATGLASGLGKLIVFVSKGFFYFFAVVVLFILLIIGLVIAIFSAALFPIKNLMLLGTTQHLLLWPAIGLIIGIPIIALIIFIVRKATGMKETSRYIGYTLSFLWLLGLGFAAIVAASLTKDFRRSTTETTMISLMQPSNGKLILKKAPGNLLDDYRNRDFDFDLFSDDMLVDDDTTLLNFVKVRVEKSNDANYHAELKRYSKGRTIQQASQFASDIVFNLEQKDSVLYLPEGFTLPHSSTFRGQVLTVVIYVPVGKKLEAGRDFTNHFSYRTSNYDEAPWDNFGGERGDVTLEMTSDGVKKSEIRYNYKEDAPVSKKKEKDTTTIQKQDTIAPVKEEKEQGYRYKGPSAQKMDRNVKNIIFPDRLIILLSPPFPDMTNA